MRIQISTRISDTSDYGIQKAKVLKVAIHTFNAAVMEYHITLGENRRATDHHNHLIPHAHMPSIEGTRGTKS